MKTKELFDVLLVEDSLDDSELTLHAIHKESKDVRVLHVMDGAEALDFIFARNKYQDNNIQNNLQLVLLDIKLPLVNGLEVLRAIREDERTKMLPVVIFSSSREKRDLIESYNLHVNSHVVKPIGYENFLKAVETLSLYWNNINEKPYAKMIGVN